MNNLDALSRSLDFYSTQYEYIMLLGNFDVESKDYACSCFSNCMVLRFWFQIKPVTKIQKSPPWKVSKYEVSSGPLFPIIGVNTGKYGPGKTPSLDTFSGIYSSTNWPPFTGGQSSILNSVLKLNPLNQKLKITKTSLGCLERALFILF